MGERRRQHVRARVRERAGRERGRKRRDSGSKKREIPEHPSGTQESAKGIDVEDHDLEEKR